MNTPPYFDYDDFCFNGNAGGEGVEPQVGTLNLPVKITHLHIIHMVREKVMEENGG